MIWIRRMIFFIKQYQKQLQKKWKSLPLLLLFPIIIIGLVSLVIIALFLPDENQTIEIGLVDLDQSEETTTMVELIDDVSLLGAYIHISQYSEKDAIQSINADEISSYVVFSENFTSDLYNGNSVEVPIVGNPKRPIDSYIVKELIDSMTRYIASAQASILTINEYAKQLPIGEEEREEMLLGQFNEFMLYTLSKDKIIQEDEITNVTTAAPLKYFSLSGWFIVLTIWMLGIYLLLGKEEGIGLWNRMRLYGVTRLQRVTSRILVASFYSFLLAMIGFYTYIKMLDIEFYLADYGRVSLFILFYNLVFLICLSFIDILLDSKKVALIIQVFLTAIILLMSGAIIPTIYFPEWIQNVLPVMFSTEAFDWFVELAINERLYSDFTHLLFLTLGCLLVLLVSSVWKERMNR